MVRIATSTAAGEAVYLQFYRAVLADPATDGTVAAVCATALANHGQAQDVRWITPLLNRDEPFVRWQAATALQRLHHGDAVGPLIRTATGDEDADTRAAAARALGQYPRRDVFDTLVVALDDAASGVARAARESLTLLTGRDVGDDPRAWLDLAEAGSDAGGELFDPQRYTYTPYPPVPRPAGLAAVFPAQNPGPAGGADGVMTCSNEVHKPVLRLGEGPDGFPHRHRFTTKPQNQLVQTHLERFQFKRSGSTEDARSTHHGTLARRPLRKG